MLVSVLEGTPLTITLGLPAVVIWGRIEVPGTAELSPIVMGLVEAMFSAGAPTTRMFGDEGCAVALSEVLG